MIASCHNRIMARLTEVSNYIHVERALLKNKKICICLIPATYFLSKKSLPYCKECRAQCSSSGKEYCQRITECRKRRLKGSMLKVNLLFIVKKTWFRQPLNAEYVTFPADRSSQRRPANMTTFGEPLAQPPMFLKSKDPPVCEKFTSRLRVTPRSTLPHV